MDTPHENSPYSAEEDPDVKDEMDNLKSDLQSLRHDVAEMMHSILESGKGQASGMKDRASDEIENRLRQFEKKMGDTKHRGEQVAESARHTVEERPFTSMLIAFGVGLLAGGLLSGGLMSRK